MTSHHYVTFYGACNYVFKKSEIILKKFWNIFKYFQIKIRIWKSNFNFLAFDDHLRKNKDIGVKPFFSFICPTNVRLYTHTLSEYSNRSNLESTSEIGYFVRIFVFDLVISPTISRKTDWMKSVIYRWLNQKLE